MMPSFRWSALGVLFLLTWPGNLLAQPPADTSRGDKLLEKYFDAQTKQIAVTCLADIKTLADWQKKRPELRRQFLAMVGLWPLTLEWARRGRADPAKGGGNIPSRNGEGD